MGFATYETGDRGIVNKRSYKTLLQAQVVPAVTVDGKPVSWKRIVAIGNVTETVREIVGLSESDAMSTDTVVGADGASISLSDALTLSGGANPAVTYSREVTRTKDGDSMLWTVCIHERSMSIKESVG